MKYYIFWRPDNNWPLRLQGPFDTLDKANEARSWVFPRRYDTDPVMIEPGFDGTDTAGQWVLVPAFVPQCQNCIQWQRNNYNSKNMPIDGDCEVLDISTPVGFGCLLFESKTNPLT